MTEGATEPMGEMWKYNPDYHRMADFLGLDVHQRQDYGLAQKISLLRDWAGLQGKDDSTSSALGAMQKLKRELGIPTFAGKKTIDEMYEHVRLSMDRKREKGEVVEQPHIREEEKKALPKTKQSPLQGMVQKAVQGAVQQKISLAVGTALKDKKMMEKTIQSVVEGALK